MHAVPSDGGCRLPFKEGEPRWSCEACDFDICDVCSGSKRQGTRGWKRGPAALPSPAPGAAAKAAKAPPATVATAEEKTAGGGRAAKTSRRVASPAAAADSAAAASTAAAAAAAATTAK